MALLARRAGLGGDEMPGETARPTVRNRERPGPRHPALPGERAGGGSAAVGELSPGKVPHPPPGPVLAASLVLLALVVGIVGTTWGLFEARRQAGIARRESRAKEKRASQSPRGPRVNACAKVDAQDQRTKALAAAAAEKAANAQAQARLKQIEAANEILGSIFENLDPREIARSRLPLQAILVQKLDKAIAQLEGESIGDPLVVAGIQVKLGKSLVGLGAPEKAIALLDKARATYAEKLGPRHLDTLRTGDSLAYAYCDAQQVVPAIELFEANYNMKLPMLGAGHPESIASMNGFTHAFGLTVAVAPPYLIVQLLTNPLSRLAESRERLGPEHPVTLSIMNDLGSLSCRGGLPGLGLAFAQEALARRRATLGADHPDTILSMRTLAECYLDVGDWEKALPLTDETLKLMRAKLGPDHLETLKASAALAECHLVAGRTAAARPLYLAALAGDPRNLLLLQKVATLEAWFGNDAELGAITRRVLELPWDRRDRGSTSNLAMVCCLRPAPTREQAEAVLALARRGYEMGPRMAKYGVSFVVGMAEYRCSHFSEADKLLADVAHPDSDAGINSLTAAFFRPWRCSARTKRRRLASWQRRRLPR